MKSMMKRTTCREIKGSFGRYLAIMAIVALGVGFFSGVKITKQAMVETLNENLYDHHFFDFHLISTLGFEPEDVEFFAGEQDVQYAEGVYAVDALYSGIGENESALKTHSVPEHINGVHVVEGRMPEHADECVLDAKLSNRVSVGDVISLTENNEPDTLEKFAIQEFTVVGFVDSSYYINFERGTTSVGTGKVDGFLYIQPDAFEMDYFTDVFICFDQHAMIYSEEYEDYIEAKEDEWEDICENRVDIRYETILSDAYEELDDAKDDLERERQEGEDQLEDAYRELTDADEQLADGRRQLNAAWGTWNDEETNVQEQEALLQQKEAEVLAQEEAGKAIIGQMPVEQQALLGNLTDSIRQADEVQREELQTQWQAVPELWQLAMSQIQLEAGKEELEAAKAQLEEGKTQLATARAELIQREDELQSAEEEAADGWQEYEDAKTEFEEKIADAETEIEDAQAEIEDIEEPDFYVLNRNTNIGYACFENDADIVDEIAKVFPVFFILVAALVCMTTMNRMVDEQRTQIGVFKALGFRETSIMGKFMFYSGSAALIGCLFGYIVGTYVFPQVIWMAYSLMYQDMKLKYIIQPALAGIAAAAALFCAVGTTWLSCRYEMQESAASLMRAKAPKAGKRVLLERVPFIWKRLNFFQKVSVRNIFRYKKRFFMMVIGISGCTALLLTGFGLKDSIAGFAKQQYEEIQIVDGSVRLTEALDPAERKALEDKLEEVTADYTYVSESSWDIVRDENVKSVNLLVFEDPETIGRYIDLHTRQQEAIPYPKNGEAVINSGLAELYHISVGDEVTIRDEDMREIKVRVSGIFENYVYHYLLITPETYRDQMEAAPEYKSIYVNYKETMDPHQAATQLMQEDDVTAVDINQDTEVRLTNTMSSLNYVVLLVIICAAALAFIVLYNLTNINITERLREIATVKVLGFFRSETASYVFRENMVLTTIGMLLGLVLGFFLHAFVMAQIRIDMISFEAQIHPLSYLYSILLTYVFYFGVNRVMSIKLERINMSESLKVIE